MPPPIAVAIGLLLVGAVLLLVVSQLNRRTRSEIEKRVSLVARAGARQPAGIARLRLKVQPNWLDARLRGLFAFGIGRTWAMRAGALKLLAVAIALAGVVWIVIHLMLGFSEWITVPATVFVFVMVPRMLLLRQQRRGERQFIDLLPSTIDTAIRMLRAGLPITSCMRFIGNNAEAPVNGFFAMIADQAEMGVPVEEALDAESQKVGLPDFRFFAVTVVLQRATGGNLASTLEILSDIMRKRHVLRQKTKAASAEIRMSAYVLGALPFVCVGLMLLLRPEYFAPLIQDSRGQVILAMACGSLLAALVTMQQMIRRVSSA